MSVTLDDFEELLHCKIANLSGLGWSAPLLQANYGGGYGAGIIANADYGLHRWRIKSDFLPDTSLPIIGASDQPYFTYIFEFLKTHILKGNKPFKIYEPRTAKYYLVRLITDGTINFERMTAKFFTSGGLEVEEARHEDIAFNSDGSLLIDLTAPTAPGTPTTVSDTHNSITAEFDPSTDDTAVIGYQRRIDGGSWANISHTVVSSKIRVVVTGLSANTGYDLEFRAYDAAGNYSNASAILTETTDTAPPAFWAVIGSPLSNNGDDSLNIDSNTTNTASRLSSRLTAVGDYIEWLHDNTNGFFVNGAGGGLLHLGINDTIYTTTGGDDNVSFTSQTTVAVTNGATCRIEIDGTNHLVFKVNGTTQYTSSFTLSSLNGQVGFYFYSGTVNADIPKPTVNSGGTIS